MRGDQKVILGVAAAAIIGFCGTGLAAMNLYGSKKEADRKVASLEKELKDLRTSKSAPLVKKGGGPDLAKENHDLAERLKSLQVEVDRLRAENAQLKTGLAKVAEQALARAPAAAPAAAPPLVAAAPPPPPPPAASDSPWGASEDSELDEMANTLKLNQEQREQTRKIILEGQNEFETKLMEVSRSGTEHDVLAIERIGEEVSNRTQARIDQILFPEQKSKFADLMKRKREGQ